MELEDTLRRLVGVHSPTGMEVDLVPLVEELMSAVGLDVSTQPVDRTRSNVIGRVGDGHKLCFCTHMDTVPVGPVGQWRHPPLGGEVEDGFMYGRGACDAKGQLTAILGAMEMLAGEPSCEVVVAAVVEEETGRALGVRRFLETEVPAAAVICEPTELVVCTSHRGVIRPEITVYGKSAHACDPASGENAIYRMVEAIKALERYGLSVAERSDRDLNAPSFTVTMIRGGEQPNVVPQQCIITVDRRLTSSETMRGAMEELQGQLDAIGREHGLSLDVRIVSQYPPSSISPDDPFLDVCRSAQRDVLGQERVGAFKAGCDMWAFREKGVPTVIAGPGSMEDIHCADERISLAELRRGMKVYEAIARRWAVTAEKG